MVFGLSCRQRVINLQNCGRNSSNQMLHVAFKSQVRRTAASYVELLTCLQAAKIEDKAKDPLGPLPTIAK